MKFHIPFFALMTIFLSLTGKAQDRATIQHIQDKMSAYAAGKKSALFVHFDKNVYTNNESIWFTGYILKADTNELAAHNTLSVNLVNDVNKTVLLNEKALISNGIASGNMILPDTISPGNYHLIACTNLIDRTGKPVVLFSQGITVKSISSQSFNAGIKLLDSGSATRPIKIQIVADVENAPAGKKLPEFKIRYRLGQTVINETTDATGSRTVTIDQNKVTAKNATLLADVFLKKEVKHLLIKLPYKENKVDIKFYPEGGYLANGVLNTVGWEAKIGNAAVAIEAVLYRDNQAIDTLKSNTYGVGKFRLLPKLGSTYSFKLIKGSLNLHDTTFLIPKAIENIPALNISKAVVNDTLHVALRTIKTMKLHVIIHNYQGIFSSVDVNTNAYGTNLKVALPLVPKGIAVVTVMDSLYKPLAERLFFAHYNRADRLSINTNKSVYNNRENVELKIKLVAADSKGPVDGLVSVACVQDNRITLANQQDIESFSYLTNELGALPPNAFGNGYADREYVENIMLVKGWRKYDWIDMMASDVTQSLELSSAELRGSVTKSGHALKSPVMVSLICDSAFTMLPTDEKGNFIIPSANIVTYRDKKVMMTVNGVNKAAFEIKATDPLEHIINTTILKQPMWFEDNRSVLAYSDSKDMQLSGTEKMRVLKEVKIKATKKDLLYGIGPQAGRNDCGDYVCPSNIINCPNHPTTNRPAVKGERYRRYEGGEMIYTGCEPPPINFYLVKGIKASKTFYPTDYSLGMSAPDYQSTIYWNNLLEIKGGEATIKFPTSDVTGPFKVVVQGLSENGVVYQTHLFEVKKRVGL